jgi:hypothetical protein
MKVTSMWFWGPVMLVFGGVMATLWSIKPRIIDAGSFATQEAALRGSLDALVKEAKANPNVASVSATFRGPLLLSPEEREFWGEKQGELWSYNRRLGAMIGFFCVKSGEKVKFAKVTCHKVDDTKLQSLIGKGARLAAAPQEFGCRNEDARGIGGRLPADLNKKQTKH